jgi:hypothetical protein
MSEPQSQAIELTAESAAKIAAGLKALPELRDRRLYEQEGRNRQATALRAEIAKLTAPLLDLDRQVQMRAMPQQDLSTIRHAWSTPIDVASLAGSFHWPTNPSLKDLERDQRDLPLGEFGWVKNDVNATMGLGSQAMADGVHMHGHVHWGGDDLTFAVVGNTDHWVLPPERIPSANRFRSAPPGELLGRISGWTGNYHPIFAADDKWCKVDLVLRHTVWQFIGATWRMCGERIEGPRRLIDLENVFPVGQASFDLWGFTPLPAIDYSIFSRFEPIWVQLEIRFETGLEGDADVWFSPDAGPASSVVERTFPWRIEGIG